MEQRNEINYKPFFVFILLALPLCTFGHTINYALEKAPVNDVVWYYLKLGVSHIVPYWATIIFYLL